MANALSAMVTGAVDGLRMKRGIPPLSPEERLDGATALVTGGASGLGFATTVDLARRGARVLLADVRDPEGAKARAVARGAGAELIEPVQVDLSDLRAISGLVASLAARGVSVDRLVLNAAIVPTSARTTAQGLDEMFVVNYLSAVALVQGLLETGVLPRDRPPGRAPRVIVISSEAHRWAGAVDLATLGGARDGSPARVLEHYGQYKHLLTTFAWELSRRLAPGVAVFALCPGGMRTGIARELPRPLRAGLDVMMRLAFQDPFTADEPVLYFACARAVEGQTARYLHRLTPKAVDPRAADPAAGGALWDATAALLARVGHVR